ncbi:MAG: hypothetical protein KIT84_05910 [Labilithrix sp.]|nr:hypothetical protein [Labilithrix sp.]MCW5810525.1 hypothetical protein [Labilithrix sp.]
MSRRREAMIVRALVGGGVVVAIALVLALPVNGSGTSEVATRLGRFHILALHLPIGVLVATLLAEAGTLLRRHRRRADVLVTSLLPLLVLTGSAAIVLGVLLAYGESYPAKLVARHRNLTLAGITVAALATFALPYRAKAGRWGHRALLGAAAGLVTLGAHFGGTITHGADFLFSSALEASKPPVVPDDHDHDREGDDAGAEEPVDAEAPPDATIEDAGAPADAVATAPAPVPVVRDASAPVAPKLTSKQIAQSMMLRKCAPCHTRNSKGGLRVTDLSNLKAGEVVPGDPANSKLYTRMTLPLDDDDHMPPQGEAQPTAGELAAVRKWITELGAAP